MPEPTLSLATIQQLLTPYLDQPCPDELATKLSLYLDLLLKWNARTNLTAIRDPAEIVTRHFGESLFTAQHVPSSANTLLDLGSGAGFPGLPIQLARSDLKVTLAESQNKKAAFLREAARTLGVATEVWAARAESMPATRRFDVVTMRAVDNPEAALQEAHQRLNPGGVILHLHADQPTGGIAVPGSTQTFLSATFQNVPRGTL